MISFLAVWID